jgi:hypothetical protein
VTTGARFGRGQERVWPTRCQEEDTQTTEWKREGEKAVCVRKGEKRVRRRVDEEGETSDQTYRKGGGEKGEEREARAVLTAASEVRRLSNALCRFGIWLLESSAFSAVPASSESVLICCLDARRIAERCAIMARGEGNVMLGGGAKMEEERRRFEEDGSGETWSRASSSSSW